MNDVLDVHKTNLATYSSSSSFSETNLNKFHAFRQFVQSCWKCGKLLLNGRSQWWVCNKWVEDDKRVIYVKCNKTMERSTRVGQVYII